MSASRRGAAVSAIIAVLLFFTLSVIGLVRHRSAYTGNARNTTVPEQTTFSTSDSLIADSVNHARERRAAHKASRDSARRADKAKRAPVKRSFLDEHVPTE